MRFAGADVAPVPLEVGMTLKDKLEIGLKEDAPYRKDNLPANQIRGPEIPSGPGRSPEIPLARTDTNIVPETEEVPDESVVVPQPPAPAADRRSPQPPIEPRT
jgi:hypothetical protein